MIRVFTVFLLAAISSISIYADTLPDSTPIPQAGDPDSLDPPENIGNFEITDTSGNPIHSIKNGDFVLMRYIVSDTSPSFLRVGGDFHLKVPDLDGTGYEPGTVSGSVLRIDFQEPFNNILWDDDTSLSAPDRDGAPDLEHNPNGISGWDVWLPEGGGNRFDPGTLYQKTLRLRNIPDHQANRWYYMVTGQNQEWPLSYQKDPLLRCQNLTADKEQYEIGETINVSLDAASVINNFNFNQETFTDVKVIEIGSSEGITKLSGPTPAMVATLAPDTTETFQFTYEAVDDGPAFLKYHIEGRSSDGFKVYSKVCELPIFIGARGDLILQDLQRGNGQVSEFGRDQYTPSNPLEIQSTAPTNRGARSQIKVRNPGEVAESYRLKLVESAADGWDNEYFFEGQNVGYSMMLEGGLIISDVPPGGEKVIDVTLKPGPTLAEDCQLMKARFSLSLARGTEEDFDAITPTAFSIFSELQSSIEITPVVNTSDSFLVKLTVKNDTDDDATNIIPNLPVGTSGDGTFEWAGNATPNFVATVAPGASTTFTRTLRRLTPGEVIVEAEAYGIVAKGNSTRQIFSNRVSADVDGGDPEFQITLDPDRPYLPEENFAAILEINHKGDAPKTYTFIGDPLTETPDDIVMIGETETLEPFTLTRTDRQKKITIPIKAEKRGKTTLASMLRADTEGGETETLSASKVVLVRSLDSEVTITPEPFLLNQTPNSKLSAKAQELNQARVAAEQDIYSNLIEIEMVITNKSDSTVENVKLEGALSPLGFISNKNPSKPGVPLVPIRLFPPTGDPIDLTMPDGMAMVEEVDLEEGESATFIWLLDGFDADETEGVDNSVDLEFEALALGSVDGSTVKELGEGKFTIVDRPLLEWGIQATDGLTNYTSGQAVRASGTLENVSAQDDDEEGVDLLVLVYQILEGNIGGGYMEESTVSKTPEYYKIFELAPEGPTSSLSIASVMRSMPALKPTTGVVRYGVRVWVKKEDGSLENVDSQATVKEGWDKTFDVTLQANEPAYSFVEQCIQEGDLIGLAPFFCSFEDKLANEFYDSMRGLAELTGQGFYEIFGNLGPTIISSNMTLLKGAYGTIRGRPGAWDSIMQELYVEYLTVYNLGVMTATAGSKLPETFKEFSVAAGGSLGSFFQAVENGDMKEIQKRTGAFLGENPDLLLEAFVLAKGFAKFSKAVVLEKDIAENAVTAELRLQKRRQAESLESRLAAGRANPNGGSLAKRLLPGDTLTLKILREVFGVDAATARRIKDIAVNNGVMLAFRARNPISIQLIRDGLAWPKPGALQYKTVNRIDIDYLGYRGGPNGAFGKVEIVEPPTGIAGKTGVELDNAIDAYMDTLRGLRPELQADNVLFAEVKNRLKTRAKEWNKYVPDLTLSSEIGGEGFSKIGVNFGAEKQFTPNQLSDFVPDKAANELRQVRTKRLDGGTDAVTGQTRRTWELAMEGPADNPVFRSITGDIDFMAMLDPSGGLITAAATRIKVYHQLAAIGMQHGESFSFIFQKKREEFLRCCVEGGEAMAIFSPDPGGRTTAGFFVDNTSILRNNENASFLPARRKVVPDTPNIKDRNAIEIRRDQPVGEYVFINGAPARTQFDHFFNNRFFPEIIDDLFEEYLRLRAVFLPSFLAELIEGDAGTATTSRNPGTPVIQADPGQGSGPPTVRVWELETGWREVSANEAISLGGPGVLDMAPTTTLPEGGERGAMTVEIEPQELSGVGGEYFMPGDLVVIDPGGVNEEMRTLKSLGSLVFTSALSIEHSPGEMAVSLGPDLTDRDEDGLTGYKEVMIGTDPDERDTDYDGFSDGEELARGTDPLSAASGLSFSFSEPLPDGRLRVEWYVAEGRTYVVEESSTLLPGSWTELETVKALVLGIESVIIPPPTEERGKRFFRVRIEALDQLSVESELSISLFEQLPDGRLSLEWDVAEGWTYVVEESLTLLPESWTEVETIEALETGSETVIAPAPTEGEPRFYRVKIVEVEE